MRKSIAILTVVLLGLALVLGGCGAKSMDGAAMAPASMEYTQVNAYDAYELREDLDAVYKDTVAGGNETGETVKPSTEGRKLIKDVDASVQTRQFETYLAAAERKVAALGGYVESKNTSDGGYYYSDMRNATLVLRVPASALDDFTGSFGELGKVTSMNESVRDVTSNYVDVATHIKALKTERDALLKLMDQAENLEDLLKVQDRLTDVRYRLDSLESQMRQMEDQIALSTVTLRIYEVERVTPEEPTGFWAKTWANFKENLFAVGRGLRDFTSGLLSAIPYLVVIAIPALLLVWLFIRRRRRKRQK